MVLFHTVTAFGAHPSGDPAAVLDLAGKAHDPFAAPAKARVFLFVRTDCPITNRYAPELARIARQFAGRETEFWLVYPDPADDRGKNPQAYGRLSDFLGQPLRDPHHELVKRAHAITAPEAAVFDGEGKLIYHGRIDDLWVDAGRARPMASTHDLEDAIQAVLDGRARRRCGDASSRVFASRCRNKLRHRAGSGDCFQRLQAAPTFSHDIAPIVYHYCAPCHRPGEAGPFPLLSYDDVKSHARRSPIVTRRRFMPPWLPEPGHGDFKTNLRLTDDADPVVRRLGRRRRAGRSGVQKLPAPPKFTEGWQLGPPDLILEASKAFTLPASGYGHLLEFHFHRRISRRRAWVRAIEIRPGDKRLVHHANLYVDRARSARAAGNRARRGFRRHGPGDRASSVRAG